MKTRRAEVEKPKALNGIWTSALGASCTARERSGARCRRGDLGTPYETRATIGSKARSFRSLTTRGSTLMTECDRLHRARKARGGADECSELESPACQNCHLSSRTINTDYSRPGRPIQSGEVRRLPAPHRLHLRRSRPWAHALHRRRRAAPSGACANSPPRAQGAPRSANASPSNIASPTTPRSRGASLAISACARTSSTPAATPPSSTSRLSLAKTRLSETC